MARVSAMPDYEFVTVDYPFVPLGVWTPDEIREMARLVSKAVISRLTA
jgi:hypothetical protein